MARPVMTDALPGARPGPAATRRAALPAGAVGWGLAFRLALGKYGRDGVLVLGLFFLYLTLPFYQGFLQDLARTLLAYMCLGWLVLALPYYTWLFRSMPPWFREEESKTVLVYRWLGRMLVTRSVAHSEAERVALMATVVKAFFFPLMLKFFVDHFGDLLRLLIMTPWARLRLGEAAMSLDSLGLTVLFLTDTVIFAVAYAVEFPLLNNQIRSVEPTFFGWFIALICYPPILDVSGNYIWGLGPAFSNTVRFGPATMVGFRIGILCLYSIYVWATIALFMRSGNLVNRGIVSHGPYRYLRHPAYAAKNLAWWLENLPQMTNVLQALPLLAWNLVYFLRAITEENHLMRDPDYRKYVKRVRYRMIPGVF